MMIVNGTYDIVYLGETIKKIGRLIVADQGKKIIFDNIDTNAGVELKHLERHGAYNNGKCSHGGFGIYEVELGDVVFKRDFIWQYKAGQKWKILGIYRGAGLTKH